jgi:hypothetical protein
MIHPVTAAVILVMVSQPYLVMMFLGTAGVATIIDHDDVSST